MRRRGRQVLELHALALRLLAVDRRDADQGAVALAAARRPRRAGDLVAGAQLAAADLGGGDVDVALGGAQPAQAQEAVALGHPVEDAGDLLGLRLVARSPPRAPRRTPRPLGSSRSARLAPRPRSSLPASALRARRSPLRERRRAGRTLLAIGLAGLGGRSALALRALDRLDQLVARQHAGSAGTPSSRARSVQVRQVFVPEGHRAPQASPGGRRATFASDAAGSRPSRGDPVPRPRPPAVISRRAPAELLPERSATARTGPRRAARRPRPGRAGCAAAARRRPSAPARARAAITTSASRSGWPGTIGSASSGRSRAEVEDRARRVAVAEGELVGAPSGRSTLVSRSSARAAIPSGMSSVRHGRLAAVALDDPVDDLRRHPPQGGQLAAGDRQHPRRGLVELGAARDVDGLLRVAGRDQRPHAGVGAGQLIGADARGRSSR